MRGTQGSPGFALLLLVAACDAVGGVPADGGGDGDGGPTGDDFELAVDPPAVIVRTGGEATAMVSVNRSGDVGDIEVTVANLPDGVTADPLVIDATSGNGALVLRAAPGATQGTATVAVSGVAGATERSANLGLAIAGPPGSPDRSFANSGRFLLGVDGTIGRDVIVDEDDRIVATGGDLGAATVATVRLHPDGAIDTSFGDVGIARTEGYRGIALMEDRAGRIVVAGAGEGGDGSTDTDFGIFVYTAGGQLDPGFDDDGILVASPVFDRPAQLHTVHEAPNGDVIVAGSVVVAPNTGHVLRYTSGGEETHSISEDSVLVFASVVFPDGKIGVAGVLGSDLWMARYLPDGAPDLGFGELGAVTTAFTGPSTGYGLVLLPGEQLLAIASSNGMIVLARYDLDGQLDDSFGIGGKVETGLGMSLRSSQVAAVDAEGRILVVGAVSSVPAVARILPDGSPDPDFGESGIATLDFGAPGSRAASGGYGLAVDAWGRILFSGEVGAANNEQLIVGRLWP